MAASGLPRGSPSTASESSAADAPGARPAASVGLTLLEAAAVDGEPLAVEALASALGQVFRAARRSRADRGGDERRRGQRGCAAPARGARCAVGVTLRLWQDPAGAEQPSAHAAPRLPSRRRGPPATRSGCRTSRSTCARSSGARSSSRSSAAYAGGETPNPCMRCNGAFRFDALIASRSGPERDELWTGHYARIVEREGTRLVARGARPGEGPVVHARRRRLRAARPRRGSRSASRRRPRPGRRQPPRVSARPDAAGEPGGVLPRGRRLPRVPRAAGRRAAQGRRRRRRRRATRRARRLLALHPRAAARPPLGRGAPAVRRFAPSAATNTVVVGSPTALAVTRVEASGQLYVPCRAAEAKLRYRSRPSPPRVGGRATASRCSSTSRSYGVAPGQVAVLYDDDAVVGAGVIAAVA